MNIFTAVKYCCILHGRVCVMFEYVVSVQLDPKLRAQRQSQLQTLNLENTAKFLNFGTPEIFAVIYLKFKQRGQT